MVSLVDRHALHHIMELLKLHGITEVIITVQYLANVVQNYYGDGSNYGINITYSVEDMPLGTAGSVKNAEHLLQEPFLVISGDALTDFNLSHIINEHFRNDAMVTITLTRVPNPLDFGVVITDEYSYVQQFLEKPSWGEVFSDTVNTGIYVLNPEVFAYIKKNKAVDWSREVFPEMLRKHEKVMGYIAEGYWTDVGTIEEYMRACADYLMGRVNLPRMGEHIGGGIWVDHDADIANDAQLHGPIYIGHGAKIRRGATIHGPAFILDYTVVDDYANVDRSVVWSNSYIGERSELRGTVVMRQCDVRNRVVLFENVVVGDGVHIGSGAVIQPNVKIWPGKEIDEGATVTSSIIWGSHARRVLFGRDGINGLVNIEITPEFCAVIGSAYGATLPRNSVVTINRDPHFTSRMLKRAIIAGLPSSGVDVLDLQSVPIPVARYFTHASGAGGGIHVRLTPSDSRMVEIKFFDSCGLDITTGDERKIESIFFRGDYRRAYLNEIGRISYGNLVGETYIKAFLHTLQRDELERMAYTERSANRPYMVVDYANADASGILSAILSRLNVDVVELNANLDENRVVQTAAQIESGMHRLTQITPVLDAHMGVRIDSGGEQIVLVDDKGRRLSGIQALAAVVALQLKTSQGGTIAVPVTAPRAFEVLAARYGGTIIRTRATLRALMQTAMQYGFATERRYDDMLLLGDGNGSYIFPSFYPIADGLFAIVKIMELLTLNDTNLSEVVDELPPYYLKHTRVPCRWESKGKVMRILNEQYHDRKLDHVDGVKIDLGEEWVLILPDADRPFFEVIAEGSSDDRARMLTEKYAGLVAGLQ
jgi:mannose-1-phosphate guanylyltransferase/phosphomannomutase